MTEISFYHMTRNSLEEVLPRLLEKVLETGMRAMVVTDNEMSLQTLDKVLWTYTPLAFLPHGTPHDPFPEKQPILLTTTQENTNQADIIVLTHDTESTDLSPYKRCLEIFNGRNEKSVQKARERWAKYKAAGHPLTYWQQSEQGKWEKAPL